MPLHDWTRVGANRFHHFHQDWTVEIARTLNRGLLPEGFAAMAEQVTGGPEPDVVTLSLPIKPGNGLTGGTAVADNPPRTRVQTQAVRERHARERDRAAPGRAAHRHDR